MANKLELTWYGKENKPKIEPRLLIENKDLSNIENDSQTENMLIHGDNLLALKALENKYAGKVKCIYIDPPYNIAAMNEYYEDMLEHSEWLNRMKPRLELLKNLLSEDGTIWIQISDEEQAYLKVLCDEVFGRSNFINMVSVNAKVGAGASGGGEDKKLKKNIEYILIYAKDINSFQSFKPIYKKTELMSYIQKMKEDKKSFKYTSILYKCENVEYYKTIKDGSNDDIVIDRVLDYEIKSVKQVAKLENISEAEVYKKYFKQIMTTTNAQTSIRKRVWDATDSDNTMYIATYIPKSGKDKGKIKKLIFMGRQKVLVIWLQDSAEEENNKIYKKERIGTYWDGFSWINVTKEGNVLFPMGKKPESLLERIITMTTERNNLVLDSFLGSGTTAAVAHKMGRKWIGIEMGDHAYTHCKVRLDKVISGEDKGGITKAANWQGGGGYRFYELAPSLINEDAFGEYIINKDYNADMLAAAVALHEGFTYNPSEETFWKQSTGSENSYLFVTTKHVTTAYLQAIADTMQEGEYLIIACKSFDKTAENAFKNIIVKKIPQMLLSRCEFNKDNYNLNIVHPPVYDEVEDDD